MKIKLLLKLVFLSLMLASQANSQWITVSSGGTKALNAVSLYLSSGYAVGDSGLVKKSTNWGSTWSTVSLNTFANLNGVYVNSASITYICGNQGQIFKTINMGLNWVAQTSPASFNYYDMDFLNANTGIVVGDTRRFAVTANGGINWLQGQINMNLYQNLDISCVDMVDNSTIFIGTADTLISGNHVALVYKSTNNGVSFNNVLVTSSPISSRSTFADIQFLNTNTGWALSQNTYIHKTTNGGTNWLLYQVGFPAKSMFFVNATTGYLCGDNGQLRKTTNGGINWLSQNSPTSTSMKDNFFIDTAWGLSAGSNGFIILTYNGGTYTSVNLIEEETPAEFSLYQNYPNPFNPSTKISFDISKVSFVRLSVYDLLGREIKTLIDEDMNAGKYEVELDASELPSGTYFYRISAGSNSKTKKMTILK
jgi:photosystem II stability/assembly factor-like uncharacterized protein